MPFHGFTGDRSKGLAAAQQTGGFSQAKMRHKVSCFDQHGRQYTFSAENSTGFPCTLISPDFSAPFMVDPKYMVLNPENTSELWLDYRAMIADRIRALREYHVRAVRVSEKSKWASPVLGDYSDDVVAACGKPPRAYQLAVAADQENPWVLGRSTQPDPRLEKYLEQPSREIDEAIDHYDFGADSYEQAVARAPRRKATKLKSFAALATRFDSPTARAQRAEINNLDIQEAKAEDVMTAYDIEDEEIEQDLSDFASSEDSVGTDEDDFVDLVDDVDAEREPTQALAEDLEEELDPDAVGGKVVPHEEPARRKKGSAKPFTRAGRPSLAQGARPIISDS